VSARRTWGWQRWIVAGRQEDWIERLQRAGYATWTVTERVDRARRLLAVYSAKRAEVAVLQRQFGGQVRAVATSEWLRTKPAPPIRIGKKLEIAQEKPTKSKRVTVPRLVIPHGLAFGSGEHATTAMLLRALADGGELSRAKVLDLGTGSGVLALAARLFGARKIVATDFDADAIRTARENEALNFSQPLVKWQRGDVLKRRIPARYDLILANLYSGILIEAAAPIAACVAPEGSLWQSGILRSQQDDVIAAYDHQGLHLVRATRRGKWVMLQWKRILKCSRSPSCK
jgi:ribosomal protein L11 methyltransferase